MMNLYRYFAADLNQFLGGHVAVGITVGGHMPLSLEEIGIDGEGHRLVPLCHHGEQNGDLMHDPDVVFMFQDPPHGFITDPVLFRNDYRGLNQGVYRYGEQGKRTHLDTKLKLHLERFAQTWFATIAGGHGAQCIACLQAASAFWDKASPPLPAAASVTPARRSVANGRYPPRSTAPRTNA